MFHELALSSPLGLDRNRSSSIPRAGFRPNLHSLTTQCAPSNVAPGQWVTEQMIDTPWASNFCHSGLLPEPDFARSQSKPANEDTPMQQVFRLLIAAFAAVALVQLAGNVAAQSPVKQLKLTEKQVDGFIAAHKDMGAVAEKMEGDKPDPKLQSQLESIAKKFGFKDFNEYDDVASNIALVMAGIDPQTKAFTDPPTAIKREIEEITADKSMPEKESKQALDELAEAMKMAQPIQFPGNIEIVKKYYDRLEPLLQ